MLYNFTMQARNVHHNIRGWCQAVLPSLRSRFESQSSMTTMKQKTEESKWDAGRKRSVKGPHMWEPTILRKHLRSYSTSRVCAFQVLSSTVPTPGNLSLPFPPSAGGLYEFVDNPVNPSGFAKRHLQRFCPSNTQVSKPTKFARSFWRHQLLQYSSWFVETGAEFNWTKLNNLA